MTINQLLNNIIAYILQPIILLMFAIALVTFFWGIIQFISTSNSDEGRETGKRTIVWGIIGMLIMIGVYGVIRILLGTFGIPAPSYLGF